MIVGTEWIIDAFDCDAETLRDAGRLRFVFAKIIDDLQLKTVAENWHQFDGEKGVTGLTMLTESHLACHTYPEHRTATFNLYCCRTRPEWNWQENLKNLLGAGAIKITKIERGTNRYSGFKIQNSKFDALTTEAENTESKIQNPKSKIAGGER